MDLTDRIIFEIFGLLSFLVFIYTGIVYIIQAPLFNWNVPLGYVGMVMAVITFSILIILFCKDTKLYIKAKKRIRKRKLEEFEQEKK